MAEDEEPGYDNISDIPGLKALVGCTLDHISGTEKFEKPDEIYLLFSNGTRVTIRIYDDRPVFSFELMEE